MGVLLTCKTQEMHTILKSENLKGRDYLEDLYRYMRTILKWILNN